MIAADAVNVAVKRHRLRDEVQVVVVPVVPIGVERDVVDILVALAEHLGLPFRIGRHVGVRRAAGDELERAVEHLHAAPDLVGDAAVFMGGAVVHLPRPVHLVAEAPDLDAVRLLRAVLPAQVAPVAVARVVAVFEHGEGFGKTLRAEIDREHRLGAGLAAPADELVGADLVGFGRLPGIVEPDRTLVPGADAVQPVVVGNEIAAGIAHERSVRAPRTSSSTSPRKPSASAVG